MGECFGGWCPYPLIECTLSRHCLARSYLFCNLPGLNVKQGERLRVHFLALGGVADMHTPSTAQAAISLDGQRRQSVRLLGGTMVTTDLRWVACLIVWGGI